MPIIMCHSRIWPDAAKADMLVDISITMFVFGISVVGGALRITEVLQISSRLTLS